MLFALFGKVLSNTASGSVPLHILLSSLNLFRVLLQEGRLLKKTNESYFLMTKRELQGCMFLQYTSSRADFIADHLYTGHYCLSSDCL